MIRATIMYISKPRLGRLWFCHSEHTDTAALQ